MIHRSVSLPAINKSVEKIKVCSYATKKWIRIISKIIERGGKKATFPSWISEDDGQKHLLTGAAFSLDKTRVIWLDYKSHGGNACKFRLFECEPLRKFNSNEMILRISYLWPGFTKGFAGNLGWKFFQLFIYET